MIFKIEFTKEALRDISNLETVVVDRILKKLDEIKEDPQHYLERLVGYDDFKLRIGEYRLICLLHGDKLIIQKIGHRKNIYKKK